MAKSDAQEKIGAIFGYFGMALTILFFLSPGQVCYSIIQKRSTQMFSPVPYVIGVFNCSLWCYYAYITMAVSDQNLWPNLAVNVVGVLMFMTYTLVFWRFSREKAWVGALLGMGFVISMLLLLFFELAVPALEDRGLGGNFHWGGDDIPLKSSMCGVFTDALNVMLYASPLAALGTVLRTRSAEALPLAFSALTLLVSITWVAQGLLIGNITVYLPNALGVLLGISQLAIIVVIGRGSSEAQDCRTPSLEAENDPRTALSANG
eukprot:TRINITY_DN23861_c0_g1_i3.p1 TRINITY_DN23861_c0_g1~~TRINITY_DN23861_c0_g1_i3.p1  ORF type:complete len:263 (-),score=49.12 TRINITY_DN23861_c0_g1_i3:107-895(-)